VATSMAAGTDLLSRRVQTHLPDGAGKLVRRAMHCETELLRPLEANITVTE